MEQPVAIFLTREIVTLMQCQVLKGHKVKQRKKLEVDIVRLLLLLCCDFTAPAWLGIDFILCGL